MAKVTITAPEGEQLKVVVQTMEMKPTTITERGWDRDGNETMVQKFGPPVPVWSDVRADSFASESRDFDLSDKQRIIVGPQ